MTATATAASLTPPAAETTALSRWEALAADIAIASEQAEHKVFNYRDRWDNKAARSWVAELRRLKGGIERARKDAKAIHLERGRAVDETAKTLEASVQGLIDPHERELKAIEAEEQARIDAHKSVLDFIAALSQGVTTAADAEARLAQLAEVDTSGLEEFSAAGAARHAEATEQLLEIRDTLRQREAEQAELEALRAEKAAREEEERQEQIRQKAIADERARAERERQAEQQRQEQERIAAERRAEVERQQAAERERDAERRAQEAAQAAAAAEARAREAEIREQARLEAERQAEADRAAREHAAQQARKSREAKLRRELIKAMASSTPDAVADAIVNGSLHKALCVDWSSV